MSLVLNIRLGEHDPWVTVDVNQAREAKIIKKNKVVQCIRNVYDHHDSRSLTSLIAKALDLAGSSTPMGASQRASVDPSRVSSRRRGNNPFGNLREQTDHESMSDMD